MSNPFANDKYGRPFDVSPEPESHTSPTSLDKLAFGVIISLMVLAVFAFIVFLMANISPDAPTRLTPEAVPLGDRQLEEEAEPQILGD